MAAQRGWGPVRISRPIVIALGIALVASAVFVGVATAPRPAPRPLPPVVYYEVLDAHENKLLEQPLDGTTAARLVVSRPSAAEGELRWEVGPGGTVALGISRSERGAIVEAVEIAGGRSLWRQELDAMPQAGVWSPDGRQWASMTEPDGQQVQLIVIVDVPAGATSTARAEPGWWPQGFTADGDLVLTEAVADPTGLIESWRFHLVQRASGAIAPVPVSLAPTGPRPAGMSDVSTEAGWAVRRTREDDPATGGSIDRLQVVDLRTGTTNFIGPDEDTDYDWFALTPDARRVLVLTQVEGAGGENEKALLVLDRKGEGAEVWRGSSAFEQVISREGHYLGMTGWVGRSVLTVVHLGSGRAVELPLPPRTIAGALRAILDPADVPLIAVAPLQPSTSSAPTPAAAPLAGAPQFFAASSDVTVDGWTGRVSILAPGEGGGVAVVETMPPLELPIPDGFVGVHPRPGTDEVLVEISSERPSRFWLWIPGTNPVELDLPDTLPRNTSQPHWRPDGGAIAFQYWRPIADEVESGIAIFDLASRDVRVIPVDGPYGDLVGWAGDGKRLLLSYQICVEGCPGRYAFVARLDPDSGVVAPFDAGDRDAAAYLAYHDDGGRTIILTSIQLDEADDVVFRWPVELAPLSGAPEWSSDRRDLQVSTSTDDVVTLYLVPDVLARGPGVFGARPIELGRLPEGLSPRSMANDREWVLAADRANTGFLVRLGSGEAWELGSFAEGQLTWLPEG